MLAIDENIVTIDNKICSYLDSIDSESRGAISQDILAQLIHLVEQVMLKFYASGRDIDDTDDNIAAAIEFSQTNGELKTLYRFRNYLQIVAAHNTLDGNASERLMLKYYQYLLETRKLLRKHFHIQILHNLNKFPLNLDSALQEYYAKIAYKINQHPASFSDKGNKYYIQKIKPFFVGNEIYYEVTFTPVSGKNSKTNRVIAFTKLQITSNYASKIQVVQDNIEILGKTMPIAIIVGWEVSIRGCEYQNFISLITGERTKVPYPEQREICKFLTFNGFSLTELMDFSDAAYRNVTGYWRNYLKTSVFIDILDRCRTLIKSGCAGQNILRYLLFNMNNEIIKDQRNNSTNYKLSNLYILNGSIPFDTMPFISSPLGHNPKLGALFACIPTYNRQHELLARQIRNNTEISGTIFTPLSDVENYGDTAELVQKYNDMLWDGHRHRSQLVIANDHIFINEYKIDTCSIIKTLKQLTTCGYQDYRQLAEEWLDGGKSGVDCDEKRDILLQMFEQSCVAAIYGSAGVGKSTLINHVSQLFNNEKKLFLAQTNPAIDNLKRRIEADQCTFSTITSFLKREMFSTDYHLLVIDESSTVNNNDMVKILNKANFNIILLVGDTYQINSIRFGNWFTALRHFIPETSVFELTQPYRAKNNQRLLDLWTKVRKMSDDAKEYVEKQRRSLKVDHTLFVKSDEDEVTLCLNYDGLYGINNINRFLQESNPNPAFSWGIQQYKVDDPVLFLESSRFHPLIYNNMKGKIVKIEVIDEGTVNARIIFDIELEKLIDEREARWYDLEYIGESEKGTSIVSFAVFQTQDEDEDDDGSASRTIVPFQIAYAVSIHKAQGLEYTSVKLVITDEVDELMTHNIFYTAITRTQNFLKIYWTPEVEEKVLKRIKPRNIDSDIELLSNYL